MHPFMVTGIVKENWNEDMPGRIQVEYRLGEEGECLSGWMPVMNGYCGPGYGSFLLPEVGTEVIVGFLHGSPDCPFAAGCLQGFVNTLPDGAAAKENQNRLMRTKGGWQMKLDEKERTLNMADDKEENKLTLYSEDGSLSIDIKTKVELKIEGETFLTLEKGKITIAPDVEISGQKIRLKAEKGLEVSGEAVTVEPDKDVTVKGKNIELNPSGNITLKGKKTELSPSQEVAVSGNKASLKPAQSLEIKSVQTKIEGTTLELKGSASAKVEAGGMLQVKGAMVKLN